MHDSPLSHNYCCEKVKVTIRPKLKYSSADHALTCSDAAILSNVRFPCPILPWKLAALAHHSESVARSAAAACLHMWDETLPDARVHHHALAARFLSQGSALVCKTVGSIIAQGIPTPSGVFACKAIIFKSVGFNPLSS